MRGPCAVRILIVALVAACGRGGAPPPGPRPTPLVHDAYVWQRTWTGAVREAVASAPAELTGLRVLALELEPARDAWPAVDAAALAASGRPITAVVRVHDRRGPDDVPMAEVLARVDAWRRAGATVRGVELDHDCPTARLPAYAAWLRRARPPAPLAFSITALPTWAGAPALGELARAVDELVVQVHAVRAPAIFDHRAARAALARFARAVPPGRLRVALPTYAAPVDGVLRRAEPADVAALLAWLGTTAAPPVRGVVWFRLPVAGDDRAWPAATLTAVIRGERLRAEVVPTLLPTGPGAVDVVLTNRGNLPGAWPDLELTGAVVAADLLDYAPAGARPQRFTAPARVVRPGATAVVGWATGKDLSIHAR